MRGELRAALAAAAEEISDPELIDPANNTPRARLGAWVHPSVLNGPSPTRSRSLFRNRFISCCDASGRFYFVADGEVLESKVVARDNSAGHMHGTAEERSLRPRVGWLEPETGRLSFGIFENTWFAPEFSQGAGYSQPPRASLRHRGGHAPRWDRRPEPEASIHATAPVALSDPHLRRQP